MATCKIRIYLPLKSNLTPYVSEVGHFDMQIIGNFTLRLPKLDDDSELFERTYTNPIISYAAGKNGVGQVSIFNFGAHNLPSSWMLCTTPFDASNVSDLQSALTSVCKFVGATTDDFGTYDAFYVTSGEFKNYDYGRHSCFAALAVWCDILGNSYLRTIYNNCTYPNGKYDAEGYKKYIAWPMFKSYYQAWSFDKIG